MFRLTKCRSALLLLAAALCASLPLIATGQPELPHSVDLFDTGVQYPSRCFDSHNNTRCLVLEIAALRQHAAAVRKQLGQLACKTSEVGPTGGWCMYGNLEVPEGALNNNIVDESLAAAVVPLLEGMSVADFGCGTGEFGRYWKARGIDWSGFDGSEGIEEASHGLVNFMDLSVSQWLGNKFDWVISLEVGEHLPEKYEAVFIGNLVRHTRCFLMLSWAIPGQGGHHHVNTRSNEYIIEQVERYHMRHEPEISKQLRDVVSDQFSWYRNTIMIFRYEHCHHHLVH